MTAAEGVQRTRTKLEPRLTIDEKIEERGRKNPGGFMGHFAKSTKGETCSIRREP